MVKFLFLIFISFSFRVFAQPNTYLPFPEDSALWIVNWTQPNNNPVQRDVYIMHGDTLISNVSYNKLYFERNIYKYPYGPSTILSSYKYLGALRQDIINKKVFYRSAGMLSDTLLYDFDLQIGDTLRPTYLKNYLPQPSIVTSIDSTSPPINGIYYKRFNFTGTSIYGHLIEGVGSDCGLFQIAPHWEGGPSLVCFITHNISALDFLGIDPQGNSHYGQRACGFYGFPMIVDVRQQEKSNSQLELLPNPTSGMVAINFSEKFQFSIHDVFGREILEAKNADQYTVLDLSSYPKGVYFIRVESADRVISQKIVLK